MRRSLLFLLIVAGWLTTAPAQAALYELDLAHSPGERTFEVQPGESLTFKVIHRAPAHRYSIEVTRGTVEIPELPPPGAVGTATEGEEDDPCQPLTQVNSAIRSATEEAQIARLVPEALELLSQEGCPRPAVVERLRETLRRTEEPIQGEFRLEEGEFVRIRIVRPDEQGGSKTWVFIFTTGRRGSWIPSYGFVFLGDQDETFFSRALDDGSFQITRRSDTGGELRNLSFTPSLFYTWLPRSRENSDWHPGWTFGLGFDQSRPVVFAGGSLNHNRFVSLIAGAAIHQQQRLNGQYRPLQPLREALSEEQLHEDRFGINFFFGLSFRFDATPFGNGSGDAQPEPAQPTPASGENP